ncbi:Undecaprenyl diphosphate synthase, partial [Rozella allomycis CSF55]
LCLDALLLGPMPRHVAFIMDGNRRYARKSLAMDIILCCIHLKIKVITVYALSSENMNRPKAEIEGLLSLFREKL